MKTIDIVIVILIIFLIIISICVVLYKNYNDKLKNIINNLIVTNNDYKDKLNIKYDLIVNFIDNIILKYKVDIKLFNDIKKINKDELCNTKNEKLLNKCYKELVQIKEDNQKNKELKVFKDIIKKYNDNELYVVSLRTYYNKNTLEYNNLIKKFPYNIISKINKYNLKNILEGKEIKDIFKENQEV